ncbi:MAG: hypothetical protein K5912_02480 [Alphaproteobacteria bacterium]|nr:hypothetical protein [Alphaproteobacteria bacterium]
MIKSKIFFPVSKNAVKSQRGGGLVEVLLALVIIAVAAPFTYSMISETTEIMHNMAIANDITSLRSTVLNFVRMNQDLWPAQAQIKLSESELAEFSQAATSGFVDKYTVNGGAIIDVYLAFEFDLPAKRVAQIANSVGADAAIVGPDKIAYGSAWAVTGPDFKPGSLIYKITRNTSNTDVSRFLHRGSAGQDNLNVMERDLNMGGNGLYNIGSVDGKSVKVRNINATFIKSDEVNAKSVYFSSGAGVSGNLEIGTLRVSGDINGFREIKAARLNNSNFNLNGRITADRVNITKSVNVSRDFILKSSTLKTINGFVGMTVGSVYAPFISTDEITFYENFGLTVSGELMVSSNAPIVLGNWAFPSTMPPAFNSLTLARAPIPETPNAEEFDALMTDGWKTK